ncbi:hypothetical protein ACFWBB_01765 [Streptomyces sp. NPDC060000]|uniref:hypothetical protein n=1 Tax=Streptomyces sp. NPDC060000 TaxID=3347031 RepID=UPI00369433DF
MTVNESDGGRAPGVADMPSAVFLSFEEYPNPLTGACGAMKEEVGPETCPEGLSAHAPEPTIVRRWEQVVGDDRRVAGGLLMSAQDSPYASGPPSGRGDEARKGRR